MRGGFGSVVPVAPGQDTAGVWVGDGGLDRLTTPLLDRAYPVASSTAEAHRKMSTGVVMYRLCTRHRLLSVAGGAHA